MEITESALIDDPENAAATLGRLKDMGLTISLDDFGTGYSSLSYLKRFPIDCLKIDRAFVRDIATDPDDAAIVTAIITMAQSLKLDVVAEGVETQQQVDFLRARGCFAAQGYFFSKPLARGPGAGVAGSGQGSQGVVLASLALSDVSKQRLAVKDAQDAKDIRKRR